MRLQLTTVCVLVGAGLALACSAPPGATVDGEVRRFSDQTARVHSPRVQLGAQVDEEFEVSAHWTADVITAATPVMAAPDAMTRATEFAETRHQAGLDGSYLPEARSQVSAGYTLSREPDYTSHTAAGSVAREVLDRRATLSVSGRTSFDRVGRSDVSAFEEAMWAGAIDAGWSHVLSPELVARLVYSIERRQGYQANPYRWVPVYADGAGWPSLVVAEQVPARRTRHAWEGFGIWSPARALYLRGGYRFYVDGWGIHSHTLRGELWWLFFDDALRTRLRLRAYRQSGADFWRARYAEPARWRSGDYRHSPMSTLSAGLRLSGRLLEWSALEKLELTASYDITHFDFDDYPVRDAMLGHLIGVSMSLETP